MPNKREKLIELLYKAEEQADKRCDGYDNCDKCPAVDKDIPCEEWLKADCLIANGVTIPVPCEHCKRHTKCLIEEQLHFVKAEDRFCCAGERKDHE